MPLIFYHKQPLLKLSGYIILSILLLGLTGCGTGCPSPEPRNIILTLLNSDGTPFEGKCWVLSWDGDKLMNTEEFDTSLKEPIPSSALLPNNIYVRYSPTILVRAKGYLPVEISIQDPPEKNITRLQEVSLMKGKVNLASEKSVEKSY